MRRTSLFVFVLAVVLSASAQAQVGAPGIDYGTTIAAGDGMQLYPYDQQDPWLHGHFQRVPAYGGFSSFRPYNYRHVFAQTQLAQTWGHAHGMPYSQQFWNRYRNSYLEGNLHSSNQPVMQDPQIPTYPTQGSPTYASPAQAYPMPNVPVQGYPNIAYPVGSVRPIGYQTQSGFDAPAAVAAESTRNSGPTDRPIHIFPERTNNR
ncbi:MAG TPA: hypothetical protein PLY87_04335 [Planctomycetaceae bacterium]|nr:hypothetical protein [Planctomycetaceae bacterium]HQZ64276.1 hypothetical protein [Planctomycetaceae bacterium]HRA86978.1 hypothetical protein [Planctomycetaceae bacterium]